MRWGLLALLAGCGGSSANAPLHKFPSQEELLRLQQVPRPTKVIAAPLAPSAGWAPATAPAEAVAQGGYEDPSPAGQALQRLAAERGLRLSGGLRCVAEEAGRFFLKRGTFPGEGLRRFLAARCGSLMTSPQLSSYTMDGVPAGAALAAWDGRVDRWLREALTSREEQVGLWVGQEAGQVVVMVAHDTPQVRLAAQPLVPDAEGKVVVRGTLGANAEHVGALVNQGPSGVAECARDLRLRLPQFGFICPLAEGDGRTWVQVTAQPPGKVLADTVLELLLHRTPADVARYTLPDASESGQVEDEAAFTAALMPVLNQARLDAGLQPLVLAEKQSQTAQALAPHFFVASQGGGDRQVQERIALGLMAGWQVGGAIRGGDLVASVTGPARDPREWLATTLESPVGRRVLLGRDSRRIAVGSLLSREPSGLGALVTTYRFYEGDDHHHDEEQVLGDLAELRRQNGVAGSVVLVRDLSETMKGMAQQLRSGQAPADVFRVMMDRIVGRMNMSAQGYLFQTTDLSAARFPEELWRRAGQLPVAVTVAHHKPPGAAWAHLVVFLIALQPAPEA